ncbi:MAG: type II toxin-antitoxin system RelE/ParE family toxin [Blastocatellia bacterium]|nr:type II toxin-antitoxin system RelE/ParE family toxin [Blastocatellia bacterium]
MNVLWFYKAAQDLEAIGRQIAKDNPSAAYETVVRIRKAGDSLAQFPESGRIGRVAGTRELVVVGMAYLIPYRIKGDDLQILRVFHGAQKWPDKF